MSPPRSTPSGSTAGVPDRPGAGRYDAIVVGSGFGGLFCARELVRAGWRVLVVERGDHVSRGPHNWAAGGTVELTPHYTLETPYRVASGAMRDAVGLYACVGGPSVFYGGVSFRFREEDFERDPEIVGSSGAAWPIGYADLEPFYREAEEVLDVAGRAGADPTEPPRSSPYPQRPAELSEASRRVAEGARRLGLSPFPLPLAINYRELPEDPERSPCARCTTCDTFACAIRAKNDLAAAVLPDLLSRGMELRPRTVAVRIHTRGGRAAGLECFDKDGEERFLLESDVIVLAAGALGSPHLLLASGLQRENPAGGAVGRHLMRHRNAIVFGLFPDPPDPTGEFHKQVGIHDFYFGGGNGQRKLGGIQQVQTPPLELVEQRLPDALDLVLRPRVDHLGGLLVMAEDQPRARNRLEVDPSRADRFGLPAATIAHRYSRRDRAAGRTLVRCAKRILREAGAVFFYVHEIETFSHAVGTVRTGSDPETAPLDPWGRFRGVENLWVVDGSFMPRSAGLNPSLTIAAWAIRAGRRLAEEGP